jgi:hypothetical protein
MTRISSLFFMQFSHQERMLCTHAWSQRDAQRASKQQHIVVMLSALLAFSSSAPLSLISLEAANALEPWLTTLSVVYPMDASILPQLLADSGGSHSVGQVNHAVPRCSSYLNLLLLCNIWHQHNECITRVLVQPLKSRFRLLTRSQASYSLPTRFFMKRHRLSFVLFREDYTVPVPQSIILPPSPRASPVPSVSSNLCERPLAVSRPIHCTLSSFPTPFSSFFPMGNTTAPAGMKRAIKCPPVL